jgi:hypothetical protein
VRVQLRHGLVLVALTAGALAACAAPGEAFLSVDEQNATSLFRYFNDSGHIAVRSLMGDYTVTLQNDAALTLHWNNERVTVPGIHAPAGSQEAVDAITTASRPISGNAFQDFVKVRNEIQGSLDRGHAGLEYYYSTETDYLAQQVGGHLNRDFSEELNLSVGASYGWDAIKPLADDRATGRAGGGEKTTLHWNAVATRIVTPTTILRAGVELNVVDGLQHNPYRNVYAGGSIVPERHPDHRQRRDAFLKLNQYVMNRSSVKLSYRFYDDDWGVDSHELDGRLSQYVTRALSAQYEYRWYTQTQAWFYRGTYPSVTGVDGFQTGDYRLGPLSSHLFGAALNLDLSTLAAEHPALGRLGVRLEYQRYFNSNNYSANILETGLDFRF